MAKKTKQPREIDSIADLEKFYHTKKEQQEALKKLLIALDEKSTKEKNI